MVTRSPILPDASTDRDSSPLRTIVVHANDPDTRSAMDDIIAGCDALLEDRTPVADRFGAVPLIGCTTDGEISSTLSFQEDSIGVMLFLGDGLVARAALARDVSDPGTATRRVVADAAFPGIPKVCLALPESLAVDALALIGGLQQALPAGTVLVGGTSGDQWRFRQTRQFCGREVVTGGLPILLLGGEIEIGIGVSSGWRPLGRVGRVTRSEGVVVHEIDHAPAVEFYREYLGHHVEPNPEFPTLVTEGDGDGYLRAPLRYQAETGSIVYTAEVPTGAGVQVTTAPTQDILDACRSSVQQATVGGGAFGAIAISCAARKQILGTRTPEECRILREALGPDVPVLGFYAYGEIAPVGGAAKADFHNETFVTLVFRHVPTG